MRPPHWSTGVGISIRKAQEMHATPATSRSSKCLNHLPGFTGTLHHWPLMSHWCPAQPGHMAILFKTRRKWQNGAWIFGRMQGLGQIHVNHWSFCWRCSGPVRSTSSLNGSNPCWSNLLLVSSPSFSSVGHQNTLNPHSLVNPMSNIWCWVAHDVA